MARAHILPFSDRAIAQAAQLIACGEPVAIPTETVYGLAADATSGAAVTAIYRAKGRPAFNPLIIHILNLGAAESLAHLTDPALHLAETFWPGPLTIVAPSRPDCPVAPLATAGFSTIALRVPAHRAMRALLAATGTPLAAPSANASGTISPTRAEHVLKTLGDFIPLIVDDGATSVGLESTIIALTATGIRILRPGPIAAEKLSAAAGLPIVTDAASAITAPGQLAHHYAPNKPLRLEARSAGPDEWLIGFGEVAGDVSLSAAGDLAEAAANLFASLHQADGNSMARIAVAPIPHHGLGGAINDRLRRAAA